MSEFHPLDAQSPYAASKVAGDRLCYAYWKTYGMDVRILRSFNTAGPYQADDSYGAVIAIFINKALNNEVLEIYGTGLQERDYMAVSGAVGAYKAIAERGCAGFIVNAGSGIPVSIIDIAEKVIKHTQSKSKIKNIKPRPGEVVRLCCNNSKILSLGWKPTKNIDQIIKEMIKHKKEG